MAMYSLLTLSAVTLLFACWVVPTLQEEYHEHCIIGAGPGGLQLGYFLERAKRDYIIFEKSNVSGSFFVKYPRHEKLISINKRFTGKTNKEFNFRHDWNSLISDDETLLLKHYSKEFFPHKSVLVRYLNDYQRRLGIKVQYNTEISQITKAHAKDKGDVFMMHDQHDKLYVCRVLVAATGMQRAHTPKFQGWENTVGYEDVSTNPDDFEGKSVLILGRGNSAFEVADSIYGSTSVIHMIARSRVRLSWATHYVGDLRAINNNLLDTYQLKSLDAVLEAPISDVTLVTTPEGKKRLQLIDKESGEDQVETIDNFAMRDDYDVVIRCLGWRFEHEIFANDTVPLRGKKRTKKYPKIMPNYESDNIPNLFFAGTNSHYLDFRKSAGGFIHGFRYTAQTLFHHLEWRYHNVPWPSTTMHITDLMNHILKRINEVSGNYQMFQVLGDVAILKNDGLEFEYLEGVPIKALPVLPEITGHPMEKIIVIVLEYGQNFSGPGNDVFRTNRATGEPSEADTSNFLHPVFYYYESLPTAEDMKNMPPHATLPTPVQLHHIVEDFLTNWDAPLSHILPLRRFLENVIGQDMRNFFAESCFKLALTKQTLPLTCRTYYLKGQGLTGTSELLMHGHRSGLM